MYKATKLIIIGFALMIFGGILLIVSSTPNINMPSIFIFALIFAPYVFFVGFILIIIGVVYYPERKS